MPFPCLLLYNISRMHFPIPSKENALLTVIKGLYSPGPDLRCQLMWIFKDVNKDRASQYTMVCAFDD